MQNPSRTFRSFLLTIGAIVPFLGCASPPEDCVLCGDGPSGELRDLQGTTWLVSRVIFETEGYTPGVNIDGVVTERVNPEQARCSDRDDSAYALDPTLGGVDASGNTLLLLGNALDEDRSFQGDLDRAMAEGRISWGLRIGELDPDNQWALSMELLEVTDELVVGDGGRPVADQSVRARSLAQSTGIVRGSAALAFAIVAGLAVEGETYLLPFQDFRVGGWMIAVGESGQPEANLGGSFSVQALINAAREVNREFDELTYHEIFQWAADIEPTVDPNVCRRVSAGFHLDLVPAELLSSAD